MFYNKSKLRERKIKMLPTKVNYFNKTHKEIDEAIKSGTVSTIGFYHRGLTRAVNDMRRNDPYNKNENKIKQYENKIAKLHRYIHDNALYEQDAFHF